MKLSKKLLITFLIFIPILLLAYLLFTKDSVFADMVNQESNVINQDTYFLKLKDSYFKTKFVLSAKQQNANTREFELARYNLVTGKQNLTLTGFEQYASLLNHYLVNENDYLFLVGDVGAHSRNLEVVKVTSEGIEPVTFSNNGQSDKSITSDLPRFEITPSQNSLDILVYNRDYDLDPLKNYLVDKYVLKNGLFEFSTESKAVANEENQPDSRTGGIK